jgi:steroid delta-isomerase-like uncharacterized protein
MTAPPEVLAISPILVGRAAQLTLLIQLMRQTCGGVGQTVLIAGEAGVGKSRLITEAIRQFHLSCGEGDSYELRVLNGQCFEPDRVLPYAPLLEILRAELATRPPDQIAAVYGADGAMLARLLPELAELLAAASAPTADSAHDQRQLTHALVRCIVRQDAQAETDRRVARCLIVEDLHWSDDASLAVLLALAHHIRSQPIALLLTYRSDEVQPELSAFLAALDLFSDDQFDDILPLTTEDVEAVLIPFGQIFHGREGFINFMMGFKGAFPDIRIEVTNQVATDEQVVNEFTARGTHTGGAFMGIPPSGRAFAFSATSIFRIADGKIVEHWGEEDALGWLQQLGAIPMPG